MSSHGERVLFARVQSPFHAAVTEAAAADGITASQFVRQAVRAYLAAVPVAVLPAGAILPGAAAAIAAFASLHEVVV